MIIGTNTLDSPALQILPHTAIHFFTHTPSSLSRFYIFFPSTLFFCLTLNTYKFWIICLFYQAASPLCPEESFPFTDKCVLTLRVTCAAYAGMWQAPEFIGVYFSSWVLLSNCGFALCFSLLKHPCIFSWRSVNAGLKRKNETKQKKRLRSTDVSEANFTLENIHHALQLSVHLRRQVLETMCSFMSESVSEHKKKQKCTFPSPDLWDTFL